MFKQLLLSSVVTSFVAVGIAGAQEPRDFGHLPVQTVPLPGTAFEIVFNAPELQAGDPRPMQPLSAAIVTWLSANFELPAVRDLPRIEFASLTHIADLHFGSVRLPAKAGAVQAQALIPARYGLLTLYSDSSRTIYLPEGWNGSTPAELSVLVKELVHHIQNVAALEYHCPQAREGVAYAAQQKWLHLFGSDLQTDFDMSPHVFALSSHCTPFP